MRAFGIDLASVVTFRRGLIAVLAVVLALTGLPLALAGDDPADGDTEATTAEATEAPADEPEATEDPVVIVPDEGEETDGGDGTDGGEPAPEEPADSGDGTDGDSDGGEEPKAEPDEQAPAEDDTSAKEDTSGGEGTGDDAKEPTRTAAPAATAADAPDGGDFSIDWVASEPFSYSHVTGGGVYASGSNATTVESLNGGDFACGDIVSYLAAITVDDSNATDASTLEFTTRFATLTSSESGIGHEDIIRAVINTGDPGMDGDATLLSLDESTGGGDLIGVITVGDLEAGEEIIVRVDVRLGCQTGGKNVGTIHASLDNIKVVAPTNEVVPGGAQTIPFKQDGVRRELKVTKNVVGPEPANATYTVEVTCLKGDTATLTFDGPGTQSAGSIPEGDTCTVTETDDGGADRTTVSVNGGAAANGHSTSVTIGATNEVTFTNTFFTPTVEVGKSASPTTVTPGGTITYTITARNTAASQTVARNVVVTDDLDDDLADVNATFSVGGGASQDCTEGAGNTIRCEVGDLAIGQAAVVTVTARATIASCGEVKNRASAAGSNFTNVSSPEVTVTVQCDPDISIVKSASSGSVVPGEQFSYAITVTNAATATAPARNVVITDDLANSLTGVSATFKVGTGPSQACTLAAGNTISCDIGTLAIGESATATILVTPTPASCPSITNRATVGGSNFPSEQSDAVDVTVTCTPALTIAKSASATTVASGDSYEYTITVRSPASATATSQNVVVTDNLHDGLVVQRPTYAVDGGAAQQCDAVGAGNTIRCAVGNLAPGSEAVITIGVTATPASCGPVVNTATVGADNVASQPSNQVTVNVTCVPALTLGKTASAGTVDAGDPITYTITATNPATASAAALDVVVTDDLDDDLTGVTASFALGGGAVTPCTVGAGNTVSCDVGDIAIDQSAVITVVATTTEAACGVVTNTSSAVGSNFATETSPTVNVNVLCPPVVVPVKSASTGIVQPNEAYTYTITTTNNAGPTGSAAEDVVITDNLDDDLTGVSASYRVGAGPLTACDPTGAGNTVRCELGDLAIGASADVVIAATATVAACGQVLNTSTATGTNFTSVTSNEVNVNVVCPGPPGISLVKTGSAPSRGVGDEITYTYEITNIGGTVLTDVTLVDDILGSLTLSLPKTELAVGESMTATATHVITQADVDRTEVVNVADTTGTSPTGQVVRDTDDETIPIPGSPDIHVEKTPNVDVASVGDTVTYEYVITNTGTTTLTDITLVDDKIGTIVSVDDGLSLEPGESATVEADYLVTTDDIARGDEVVNVAIVTGLPPEGEPVTDRDRAKIGITDVLATGILRVVKVVDGDGEPPAGPTFGFSVDCGDFAVGPDAAFSIGRDGGRHEVGVRIPEGQDCRVVETRTAQAQRTTVAVGTAAPQVGTVARVTITPGVTTVTYVNTYSTRPLPPPPLPATGTNLMLQLLAALAALAFGTALVRRARPAGGAIEGRRRTPDGWSTRL